MRGDTTASRGRRRTGRRGHRRRGRPTSWCRSAAGRLGGGPRVRVRLLLRPGAAHRPSTRPAGSHPPHECRPRPRRYKRGRTAREALTVPATAATASVTSTCSVWFSTVPGQVGLCGCDGRRWSPVRTSSRGRRRPRDPRVRPGGEQKLPSGRRAARVDGERHAGPRAPSPVTALVQHIAAVGV